MLFKNFIRRRFWSTPNGRALSRSLQTIGVHSRRARGEHGIINGPPTPDKLEEEPGQISAEWTGVGGPFIIPCSPRAR